MAESSETKAPEALLDQECRDACATGDVAYLRAHLEHQTSMAQATLINDILTIGLEHAQEDTIHFALEHGAIFDRHRIMKAVDAASLTVLTIMLNAGVDINDDLGIHGTILVYATGRQLPYDYIKHLFNFGADPNAGLLVGKPGIVVAAQSGRSDVLELWLKQAPRYTGSEVLWAVAYAGRVENVRVLLKHDPASVNELSEGLTREDRDRRDSPLHAAVRAGHREVVEVLLANGADPVKVNGQGQSAIDLARNQESSEIASMLTSGEV